MVKLSSWKEARDELRIFPSDIIKLPSSLSIVCDLLALDREDPPCLGPLVLILSEATARPRVADV